MRDPKTYIRMGRSWKQVPYGGSGAKAPPLAARPKTAVVSVLFLTGHTITTQKPYSHLYFGDKWPVLGVSLGLATVHAKDSVTLYIHTNHYINTHNPNIPWEV